MKTYSASIGVNLTLIDIRVRVDKNDSDTISKEALKEWLKNKDSDVIEAMEEIELYHYKEVDDQPETNVSVPQGGPDEVKALPEDEPDNVASCPVTGPEDEVNWE